MPRGSIPRFLRSFSFAALRHCIIAGGAGKARESKFCSGRMHFGGQQCVRGSAAQRAIASALECDPNLRLSNLKNLTPFRQSEDFARFADGLSKAGLPD